MKATGIVRRIDELGRIVIPKEIRRTLQIRETDPMEIYTDRDGQIILKKYSPIGEMVNTAKQFVESLAQVSGHAVLVADREQFIAAAGGYRQLIGRNVSKALDDKMHRRESVLSAKGDRNFIPVCDEGEVEYQTEAIVPILCAGDMIGSVMFLQNDSKQKMGETEQKLLLSAAGFLGRQME